MEPTLQIVADDAKQPPAPAAPETPQQAHARAQKCHHEIVMVLGANRCRIVPMLTSEPVGTGPGARALIGATYGVIPDPID